MSKKEFKVGDKVLVKGELVAINNDFAIVHVGFGSLSLETPMSKIIPAPKTDDTVYEYRYLLFIKNTGYWQETIGYFTSKKEAIRKYISSKPYADGVVSCAQRLTHTKRVRK